MTGDDQEQEKNLTLQAVRVAIRARSLKRLKDSLERPWAVKVQYKLHDANPSALYRIFKAAVHSMAPEDRKKAFQWTWNCYHPFMSDLGKALEDMDGYVKQSR